MSDISGSTHGSVAHSTTPQRSRPTSSPPPSSWIQFHVVRRVRSYGLSVFLDVLSVFAAFGTAISIRYVGVRSDAPTLEELLVASVLCALIYAAISYLLGLQRRLWRYASLKDGFALTRAVLAMVVVVGILHLVGVAPIAAIPPSVVVGGAFLSFLYLGSIKILPRAILLSRASRHHKDATRVLIVGAGQAGALLASRFQLTGSEGYRVVGFIDDDPSKSRARIHGLPILGSVDEIPDVVARVKIALIVIALPSAPIERLSAIIATCQETSARIRILPPLDELAGTRHLTLALRDVNIAELLGRPVIALGVEDAFTTFANKTILVTGAAGSIGSDLCRQLLSAAPRALYMLDNNETGLFDLEQQLLRQEHSDRLRVVIGDITRVSELERLFATAQPDVIFHAAAYKHVPLLETHPDQAARTNVWGTYHLCRLARTHGAQTFVFISTDKAADPVNVLGASKRAAELIVQAFARSPQTTTRFCSVRFGNVIGSRGSVVPTFLKQIEHGGPVTVTDPNVMRYFMTISEACGLVIVASSFDDEGGLYLLDMGQPVRIADLAAKMIRLRGLRVGVDIPITYSGLRPGEKLCEVLAAPDEEITTTAHPKIARVVPAGSAPDLGVIAARLEELDTSLAQPVPEQVRESLFHFATPSAVVIH